MSEQHFEIQIDGEKGRLDRFLSDQVAELSRSAAQRLIEDRLATVNGEPTKASYKIKNGDLISVRVPGDRTTELVPEAIPLSLIYEDKSLLVVDKPAGMVVHPAPGHPGGTLLNAVLSHCPELAAAGGDRPGIVHRLDQDTSGLILVAKSERIQRLLQRQFKERTVHKAYLALLNGHLQPAWGRIEAPIGRDPHHRQRMTVLYGGREATTEYHVLEQFAHATGQAAGDYSLVQAEPRTGRTHQIRVHFASIKHPVVGDAVYGRRRSVLPVSRQFLHARQLGFKHPGTGQRMELESPIPPDLASVLELLRG